MDNSKILTADLLDLIFMDRNKDYGAYELRRSYSKRIKKALLITFTLALLGLAGSVLARSFKPQDDAGIKITSVDVTPITEKQEEIIKEPEKKKIIEPVRTEQFSTYKITEDDQVAEPPPSREELENAKFGFEKIDGIDAPDFIEEPQPPGNKEGIVDEKPSEPEDYVYPIVEIPAKYAGNWEKFLLRHLRGEVPVENGAPAGRHTVIIQFIVDKEGNVSDIKAMSNVGFGMEEEAIRVLRKAEKWEPAIQAGYKVKAYRTQRITFEVLED